MASMDEKKQFEHPLNSRYASQEMTFLFSPFHRHRTWRLLWIALAESQKELGLAISEKQIQELRRELDHIDWEKVASYEKDLRHDVMAHIHAYGDLCPHARPIIHLGATSCYVTDNTDLLQMSEALRLLEKKLSGVLLQLSDFAQSHKDLPCLAYTHFQSAQPTTVGKRACLWAQDFLMDLRDLRHRLKEIRFLGAKGTTGTQASFLALFDGDHKKVDELDKLVAKKMKFSQLLSISGQTYSRKQDLQILRVLEGIAVSAHKLASDVRLLAHLKELEEPFESKQIGSSAMPYKRNPMRCERVCGLSRWIQNMVQNASQTASQQWFERTLDDSANRRMLLPEAFLATDSILNLLLNVTKNFVVFPKVIERRLNEELPFMATENILMLAVKKGGDRQLLHEKLRQHSQSAAQSFKEEGLPPRLSERIASDSDFSLTKEEIDQMLEAKQFIGRAPQQVELFLREEVLPALEGFSISEIPQAPISL